MTTTADVARRLAIWTAVCTVSAAPSFFWAMDEFHRGAMIAGVACFILIMTAATCTDRFRRFSRRPFVRRTLYIGYGTRMIVSLALPIGALLDVYPGVLSIAIANWMGLEPEGFVGTFTITMIQGTLLNVIIGIYVLLLYGVQRLVLRPPPPPGACISCGYDLRGSTSSPLCPECGAAIRGALGPAC